MHENKNHFLPGLLFALYLAFFVSLIFSFRAISSIAIAFILITSLIKNKIDNKRLFNSRLNNPLVISCCLFFIAQLISLSYTTELHEGWRNIRLKSALLVIPLALCCCDYIDEAMRRRMLKWYCLILFAACFLAVGNAFRNYSLTGNLSVFVYHSLVSLYSGHAIQFSILVFVALLHLLTMVKRKEFLFSRIFHFSLILFFLFFLFLLSSKLVIVFFLFYFLFDMTRSFINHSVNKQFIATSVIGLILVSLFVFSTPNLINNRFREIAGTNFGLLQKEKFNPGIYFNGLQFRLLQWRFVPQVLNESKAWLAGVSVGDAQGVLNQKYISEHMYTGTSPKGDEGFIGYNTHNEFLEAALQTGLIGLLLFFMINGSLITMALQKKRIELSFITLLLVLYSFSESVFETQYSLFIFLFFPLFFYQDNKSNHK